MLKAPKGKCCSICTVCTHTVLADWHLHWYSSLDEFNACEVDPGFLCGFRYHPQYLPHGQLSNSGENNSTTPNHAVSSAQY